MREEYPLARLAQLIVAARIAPGSIRLSIRNTQRFGVIHLYFRSGGLVRVHGHVGLPEESLSDLATWQYGTVRMEEAQITELPSTANPRLNEALAEAIQQMQAYGVVMPAPQPASRPTPRPAATRAKTDRSVPQADPLTPPPLVGAGGLPPLIGAHQSNPRSLGGSITSGELVNRLTIPQWQMLALIVRQIVQKAAEQVGISMADTMLRQALAHATRAHPILLDVEVDASGWLQATSSETIAHYSTFDVADAIAALLTGFETRCASLVGPEQAQRIIASVTTPFRASLEQMGLHIAV